MTSQRGCVICWGRNGLTERAQTACGSASMDERILCRSSSVSCRCRRDRRCTPRNSRAARAPTGSVGSTSLMVSGSEDACTSFVPVSVSPRRAALNAGVDGGDGTKLLSSNRRRGMSSGSLCEPASPCAESCPTWHEILRCSDDCSSSRGKRCGCRPRPSPRPRCTTGWDSWRGTAASRGTGAAPVLSVVFDEVVPTLDVGNRDAGAGAASDASTCWGFLPRFNITSP